MQQRGCLYGVNRRREVRVSAGARGVKWCNGRVSGAGRRCSLPQVRRCIECKDERCEMGEGRETATGRASGTAGSTLRVGSPGSSVGPGEMVGFDLRARRGQHPMGGDDNVAKSVIRPYEEGRAQQPQSWGAAPPSTTQTTPKFHVGQATPHLEITPGCHSTLHAHAAAPDHPHPPCALPGPRRSRRLPGGQRPPLYVRYGGVGPVQRVPMGPVLAPTHPRRLARPQGLVLQLLLRLLRPVLSKQT